MKFDFSTVETQELERAIAARLRELDKAFAGCVKGGAQDASEKVADRIQVVRGILTKIKDEQ